MLHKKLKAFAIGLVISFYGFSQQGPLNDSAALFIKSDSLLDHIKILSSDLFLGRMPGTVGEKRTIEFLREQYIRLGLQPGNGDRYQQEVPMPATYVNKRVTGLQIVGKGESIQLEERKDFSVWSHYPDTLLDWRDKEIVFAGYGIVSAKYHRNDYQHLNVKGKIVMLLWSAPGKYDDSLNGRTYKAAEAARHGAIGCLYVFGNVYAPFSFDDTYHYSKITTAINHGDSVLGEHIRLEGFLTLEATRKILLLSENDTSLFHIVDQPGFIGKSLQVHMAVGIQSVAKAPYVSYNLIGRIPGAQYPEEAVVYTAHWDHLGVGIPDERGDSIYNGAADNAVGISCMIEIARAFRSWPTHPGRTILFVATTAEETGTLGSRYYVSHPVTGKTIANINLDGINTIGRAKDFVLYGGRLCAVDSLVEREITRDGRTVNYVGSSDLFERGDQINFARAGIPAIFPGGGSVSVSRSSDEMAKIDELNESRYHQPSDEYDPYLFDLSGLGSDLFILFCVGRTLASGQIWPSWYSNSPYKAAKKAN